MWKSGFIYDRVKIMQEKEREKGVWKSKAWEPSCQKNRDKAFWIASGGSY